MTTTREKALEAALSSIEERCEELVEAHYDDLDKGVCAIKNEARAALALPSDQPAAPAPVAAGEQWEIAAGDKRYVRVPNVAKPINAGSAERARLIAAAPDMLAALRNLIRPLKNGWKVSDMAERIADAESAIARATGREG